MNSASLQSPEVRRFVDEMSGMLRSRAVRMGRDAPSPLYRIIDEAGREIPFQQNPVQREFHDLLWHLNIVLKSRQHGITTDICILWLDTALFRANTSCGIIAHKIEDANKFFRNKILFAYDRLPDWLKDAVPITKRDESGYIEFGNGSSIQVGVSLRSGTYQRLHVSEYGIACADNPARADEIRTGALNTIQLSGDTIVVIESTAKGKGGDFYNRCDRAMKLDAEVRSGTAQLSRGDYKFIFFPWWRDARNQLHDESIRIGEEWTEYFASIEKEIGQKLELAQKRWYVKKAIDQGERMTREHPSTAQEAFAVSVQGAYYQIQMNLAYKQGRICELPILLHLPVYTFWDLGHDDCTAIWFMQQLGQQYRFVDYYENSGHSIDHYAQVLADKARLYRCRYGKHYLPHDVDVVELTRADGLTRKQVLEANAVHPIKVVERISRLDGEVHDACRAMLNLSWFDKERCKLGISRLEGYRKRWNKTYSDWDDTPADTIDKHGADAYRQFAQGYVIDQEAPGADNRGVRSVLSAPQNIPWSVGL